MPLDKLLGTLLDMPGLPLIDEDELMRMLDRETERLSEDARVHDFIRLFAAKRVRERLLRASCEAQAGSKHDCGARHQPHGHR